MDSGVISGRNKGAFDRRRKQRRRTLATRRPPNNGSDRPATPRNTPQPRRNPPLASPGPPVPWLRVQPDPEPDPSARRLPQPAAFLPSRASGSAVNAMLKTTRSVQSPQDSYLRAGNAAVARVFHEMLRVTPTSRELWMLLRRGRRLRCARAPRART